MLHANAAACCECVCVCVCADHRTVADDARPGLFLGHVELSGDTKAVSATRRRKSSRIRKIKTDLHRSLWRAGQSLPAVQPSSSGAERHRLWKELQKSSSLPPAGGRALVQGCASGQGWNTDVAVQAAAVSISPPPHGTDCEFDQNRFRSRRTRGGGGAKGGHTFFF